MKITKREFWNSFKIQTKPKFDEVSAYLIAFAFCWLFIFHPELRRGLYIFFTGFENFSLAFMAFGLLLAAGLFLSLFHVFFNRKKSAPEKFMMGWFLMGTSIVASFFLGSEMLSTQSRAGMLLPIWNFLASVIFLIQMGTHQYDISNEDAPISKVLMTTALLLIILLIFDLYLRLSFAMIMSICVFYATSVIFLGSCITGIFGLKLPGFSK
jgi:hypothetical protein